MSEVQTAPRSKLSLCREWACWFLLVVISAAFWFFVIWQAIHWLLRLL